WEISRPIRPARHKEQLDEYSIECHERVLRLAENRARIHVGHSAHVLVDATRIVGEPFDLRCAAGGRWSRSVRLLSQLDCGYLGKAAAAQSGATSSAIRHGGRSNDAYRYRRECVLLSRRAAQRAPRPQHSVLEVAACVRCHHRACESVHPARNFATADLCDHRRHAVAHAAAEQRRTAGERSECRHLVDEVIVFAHVMAAAVPRSHGPCALARTNLLLAAARIRMAAPGDISMGGLAAGSDCRGRADCFPHLAFRCHGGVPIDGRRTHCRLDITRYVPNRPNDTYRPGSFPEQPGSVDRPGTRRGLPGSRLSRAGFTYPCLRVGGSVNRCRVVSSSFNLMILDLNRFAFPTPT